MCSIFGILKSRSLSRCAVLFCAVLGCLAAVACGQKGNLVLPTEPAAANRASLPQSLIPSAGSGASEAGAAAPITTQDAIPRATRPSP